MVWGLYLRPLRDGMGKKLNLWSSASFFISSVELSISVMESRFCRHHDAKLKLLGLYNTQWYGINKIHKILEDKHLDFLDLYLI